LRLEKQREHHIMGWWGTKRAFGQLAERAVTSKDDLHGAKYNAVDPDAASIIEAALVHVPFDGWGQAALNAGAADAGFTADDVARLFPSGALDAIVMHSAMADAAMVAAFEGMPDRPDRIHLMVRQMILIRLDQAAPHKEAVRRGLAILAVPGNALASARALYATVDAIWRAAGQTDTDISFYTKRATLAAVYSATLLAWIADTSGDPAVVEGFLDRRLRDVAQIPKATGPFRGAVSAGQRLAEGMFQVVGRVRR
jgi:ubiquinone biosynthesis protein COQ9